MSWRKSVVGKFCASVAKYGFRSGIEDSLARWGQSRLKVPRDVCGDYRWLLNRESPAMLQASGQSSLRINWLVPEVTEASGGLLNVVRAIYHLEQWGHRHRIYVVGDGSADASWATDFVRKKYFPIQASVENFTGQVVDSDALVATLWKTAYVARTLGNTARKFYFVQDLEYLFYPAGSLGEFAKQTYRWGFSGITLGPWIADVLGRDFGMQCVPFGFSYDRDIYSPHGRRLFPDGKKRVLFYARPRTERRGFELGILALSIVARKVPDAEFVLVGFPPRSLNLPFRVLLPGVLPPSELAALYRSCNLALVLSHTNLSMLPLELMACDCALVSNTGHNVEWLLTGETSQLANADPESLADAVMTLLHNQELRNQKVAAGRALAERTNWSDEIRTIESAFYQGLKVSSSSSAVRDAGIFASKDA
jgi:glycosyltransferase involved in cell wall biosynthesis